MAGAGIAAGRAALVTLGVAQPIRLRIQKRVQRLLHAAPHHPVEVVLDPLIVDRDDVVQRNRLVSVMAAPSRLTWLRLATSKSARSGPPALPICAKDFVRHLMGTVRRVCRNVKRWRNAAMALRWTAAGMMEAAKGFRRLKAYKHLPVLRAALAALQSKYVTQRVEHDADAA